MEFKTIINDDPTLLQVQCHLIEDHQISTASAYYDDNKNEIVVYAKAGVDSEYLANECRKKIERKLENYFLTKKTNLLNSVRKQLLKKRLSKHVSKRGCYGTGSTVWKEELLKHYKNKTIGTIKIVAKWSRQEWDCNGPSWSHSVSTAEYEEVYQLDNVTLKFWKDYEEYCILCSNSVENAIEFGHGIL